MSAPLLRPTTLLRAASCLAVLWGWLLAAPVGKGLDLMPHSFSRSKQFVVYAREGALRGAIGTLGEETKRGILGILDQRDDWKIPIVLDLRAPDPGLPGDRPPIRLIFAQTGTGLKIELDLLTGEAGRGTRIQDELVRTVVLSLAYRESISLPAGRPYTLPPPWLVEGISAYLDNQENGVSATLFAALLPTLQTMSCTDFLGKDPSGMDSTSRGVYRAWAYNLVCLLLRELPGGRDGLAAFIHDLPNTTQASANSAETLGKYFPELAASPDALAKWWTLALARLATADRYQPYTVEETERQLQALMTFPGPVQPKSGEVPAMYTLADYETFTPLKQNEKLLKGVKSGLVLLAAQASPFYQPIVAGYQEVVKALSRSHTKGIAERLHALEAMRRKALQRRDEIADYVNWYEATQMATKSSAFNDYFQAAHQLETPRKIHRPDAISAYLDSLDTEFQ